MPFIGLTPFLPFAGCSKRTWNYLCQCPSSGLLHFYNFLKIKHNNNRMCQCPSSGLLHFYIICLKLLDMKWKCQCPSSGLLHFYKLQWSYFRAQRWCVNALHRAYSISTKEKSFTSSKKRMCQCPSSGLLHFYGYTVKEIHGEYVSMPFIGLTPFLRYPLRTRIKWRHNSDTIAGNCLTI